MEIAILLAVVVGITTLLRAKNVNSRIIWAVGLIIFPAVILIDEFILPYRGGGASMWPIAIFVSFAYSTVCVLVGLSIGSYLIKKANEKT